MKYYIISGEASGDLYGALLIEEIKSLDNNASFRCWGGDHMKSKGVTLVKHYKEMAFMGFTEVLLNIKKILSNLSECKKDLIQNYPDALILIDYPGFNLRIAKFAKEKGIKVFYYISPQIWAWHKSRGKLIKNVTAKLFVILPFEKEFYKKNFNYDVDFVGHPLIDALIKRSHSNISLSKFAFDNNLPIKPIIAILPGSRKQEICTALPIMLKISKYFPDYQFIIGGIPSIPRHYYDKIIHHKYPIVFGKTYDLLESSNAALVTSGTATLETALLGVPQVVCYKGNMISYHIAKRLIKIKHISLVNLILRKECVKELIQQDFNPQKLQTQLKEILENTEVRARILDDYKVLQQKLGGPGASALAAKLLLKTLAKNKV